MMNQNTRSVALGILALLVIIVLAFVAFKYATFQSIATQLPESDTPVVFIEGGVAEQYFIRNHQLVRAAEAPFENGVVLRERAESPVNAEEAVVLASVPGVPGITAAILTTDNVVRLLVAGNTNKSDLVVREDGLAIFAALPAPEEEGELTSPRVGGEEPAENTVEEVGYADGPVAEFMIPVAPIFPELVVVDIRTSKITSIGQGYSPRLQTDGSLLAIAPEGVVRIDPQTADRTIVVAYQGDPTRKGSLSPSGMTAALPGPDSTLEFYRLSADMPAQYLGYLQREGGGMHVALPDDEHVFVRTAQDVARYYNLPTDKLPIATPLAIVSIIQ